MTIAPYNNARHPVSDVGHCFAQPNRKKKRATTHYRGRSLLYLARISIPKIRKGHQASFPRKKNCRSAPLQVCWCSAVGKVSPPPKNIRRCCVLLCGGYAFWPQRRAGRLDTWCYHHWGLCSRGRSDGQKVLHPCKQPKINAA